MKKGNMMQINRVNNYTTFGARNPYMSTLPPKGDPEIENDLGTSITFRDDELFDPELDLVGKEYKVYDYNDIPLYKPARDSQLKLSNQILGITDMPRLDINTDVIAGYAIIDNVNEEESSFKDTRIQILNEKSDVLIDACHLKNKTHKPESSFLLFNKLKLYKQKTDCSYYELASLARLSKLRKSNKTEYVDPKMIDAVIYCHENFPHRTKAVLNAMVMKDAENNEVFSDDAFQFLVKSKIFAERRALNFFNYLTEKDYYNNNKNFNSQLAERILELQKEGHSQERLEYILETASSIVLGHNSKIDNEVIDAIIFCQDKFPYHPHIVASAIMMRTKDGEIYLSKDALDFLKEHQFNGVTVAEKIIKRATVIGKNNSRSFDRELAEYEFEHYYDRK